MPGVQQIVRNCFNNETGGSTDFADRYETQQEIVKFGTCCEHEGYGALPCYFLDLNSDKTKNKIKPRSPTILVFRKGSIASEHAGGSFIDTHFSTICALSKGD